MYKKNKIFLIGLFIILFSIIIILFNCIGLKIKEGASNCNGSSCYNLCVRVGKAGGYCSGNNCKCTSNNCDQNNCNNTCKSVPKKKIGNTTYKANGGNCNNGSCVCSYIMSFS